MLFQYFIEGALRFINGAPQNLYSLFQVVQHSDDVSSGYGIISEKLIAIITYDLVATVFIYPSFPLSCKVHGVSFLDW